MAFTDNEPGWKTSQDAPGTNYLPVVPESVAVLREQIEAARRLGAGLVMVSAHWGPNMRQRPPPAFGAFARGVIEAGADIFHGDSAHVFQGIEFYRGKPILYDSGEFVDDYALDPLLRNDWGLLYWLHIQNHHIGEVTMLPLLIKSCQVNLATGPDREAIFERPQRLSAELGSTVSRQGARLWVAC